MTAKTSANRYFEAVGRRKTAIARVRLYPESKTAYEVNGRALDEYFPTLETRTTVSEAITGAAPTDKFRVSIKVYGGGIAAQSEAVRHGIARALTVYQADLRGKLKKAGFLKRDPRAKERRKFGLKKARKSPQWSKR